VVTKGDVRRSRLFYLRALRGKAARLNTQDRNQAQAETAASAAKK
jgi:hypothetical protein